MFAYVQPQLSNFTWNEQYPISYMDMRLSTTSENSLDYMCVSYGIKCV